MKKPHWDLNRVKQLAASRDGVFVQMGRGSKTEAAFNGERKTATAQARATIAALTPGDFSESKKQTWDVCDVYGVTLNGAGWYLKITVDDTVPEVAVVSFHPADFPIKTKKGTVQP